MRYIELPDTPENLMNKTYAVVAMNCTARGEEAVHCYFENVRLLTDEAGKSSFRINMQPVKHQGPLQEGRCFKILYRV